MLDPKTIYDAFFEGARKWYAKEPIGTKHPPTLCLVCADGSLNFVAVADASDANNFFMLHEHAVGSNLPNGKEVVVSLMMVEAAAVQAKDADELMKDGKFSAEAVKNHPSLAAVLVFDLRVNLRHAVMMCRIDRPQRILHEAPFEWVEGGDFKELDDIAFEASTTMDPDESFDPRRHKLH